MAGLIFLSVEAARAVKEILHRICSLYFLL